MNLTEYAKHMGISFRTAQRWYRDGQLPHNAYRPGRMILVDVPDEPEQARPQTSRSVIYLSSDSPTSSSEIKAWTLQHGIRIDETHCRKSQTASSETLKHLLADPAVTRIVTDSHPAADLISAALAPQGREFITTHPATPQPFKPRIAN